MSRSLVIVSLLCLALLPSGARAQTSQTIGIYQAGWNMAGGPTGTNFSSAAYLDGWQNGAYTDASTRTATACTGYWAYFADPAAVPLPLSNGPTQTCALQPGWNLVGNPFSGVANLPAGMTGYVWRPLISSYAIVSAVDPGSAIWIYAAQPGSVTLTYAPATPTSTPATFVVSSQGGPGPYLIHVGDSVKVVVPGITAANVTADPAHFTLETSGYQYDLSCTNATCQTNPTDQFWTWRAVAAGTAMITVTPTCTSQAPACAVASTEIQFTILP